jgi:hypothetical protein
MKTFHLRFYVLVRPATNFNTNLKKEGDSEVSDFWSSLCGDENFRNGLAAV